MVSDGALQRPSPLGASNAVQLFVLHHPASSKVKLLEYFDDLDLMEGHGPAAEVNYRIAAPLLADLRNTLQVCPPLVLCLVVSHFPLTGSSIRR